MWVRYCNALFHEATRPKAPVVPPPAGPMMGPGPMPVMGPPGPMGGPPMMPGEKSHLWVCEREKAYDFAWDYFLKNEDIQRMHSTYSLVVKAGLYSVSHSAAFITIINCCTNKVKKSRRQVSIVCFYEVKFLKTCKQYRKRTSCWQQTQHYAVDISCFVIKSNTASWVLKSTKTYKHHHSKQNRNLQ